MCAAKKIDQAYNEENSRLFLFKMYNSYFTLIYFNNPNLGNRILFGGRGNIFYRRTPPPSLEDFFPRESGIRKDVYLTPILFY